MGRKRGRVGRNEGEEGEGLEGSGGSREIWKQWRGKECRGSMISTWSWLCGGEK